MDHSGEVTRKDVYVRLEQMGTGQWEQLRGSKVRHAVFGEGTVSKVMMPDWSNPVRLAVKFGTQEKVFHLSSFGDRTKFPEQGLPDQLREAISHAEQEIAQDATRREDARQQQLQEARDAELYARGLEAARLEHMRQAEELQETQREEQAAAWLTTMREKVNDAQLLTAAELRILLQIRQHELLFDYYERLYARTHDARAIVKACTHWRDSQQPEYALRVTNLLLDTLDRLSGRTRALVLCARGGTLLDLHRFGEAQECAQQAASADVSSAEPHILLGQIFQESDNFTESARSFAKARQLADTRGIARIAKVQRVPAAR